MAAGFTIETGKLDEFKKTLEELATEAIVDELLQKKLTVDCYLPFSLISPEVYKTINTLAPFGMKNAQPVFMTKGITVRDKRFLGKEGKHLRLVVQDEMSGKLFEAIGFNLADKGLGLQVDDMITLIYTLDENTWNGTTKLQLKIKDFYL